MNDSSKQNLLKVYLHHQAQKLFVGELYEKNRQINFEYADEFIKTNLEISPYNLPLQHEPQIISSEGFDGLPGVFYDSLPDGWGLLLMDRYFRSQGLDPVEVTALMRLAYIGDRGMGALSYEPADSIQFENHQLNICELAKQSQAVYAGEAEKLLPDLLLAGGSPAGARPKILVGLNSKTQEIIYGKEDLPENFSHYLVKFFAHKDDANTGRVEFAYALMAKAAGIDMPASELIHCKQQGDFFAVERFDRKQVVGKNQRIHVHSLCGLLQSSYRVPANDYIDYFKVCFDLTKSISQLEQAFRRMVFNVLTYNRDDHTKNFAFMLTGNGWQLTPAFDLTFSPGPGGEHSMTIAGEGRAPSRKNMLQAAKVVNILDDRANQIVDEVLAVVLRWYEFADCAKVAGGRQQELKKVFDKVIGNL